MSKTSSKPAIPVQLDDVRRVQSAVAAQHGGQVDCLSTVHLPRATFGLTIAHLEVRATVSEPRRVRQVAASLKPSVGFGISVSDFNRVDVIGCAMVKPCRTALRIKGSESSAVHGGPSGRLSSQALSSSDGCGAGIAAFCQLDTIRRSLAATSSNTADRVPTFSGPPTFRLQPPAWRA